VRLSEALDDVLPDDPSVAFGDTWVDQLVLQADLALAPPIARWIRLCVGMAADEYHLTNAEMEAVERVRGDLSPDWESDLSTWLATVDQRSRVDLLREGIHALAWLRTVTW
jgi:hypothetical protein